jgi:hypothetical protein
MGQVKFDPNKFAVLYYFGALSYWQLPAISADALEHGFDGRFLRRLAGLVNPVASDIRPEEIDSAFREMGVDAPLPKDQARLALAAEAARRAIPVSLACLTSPLTSEYTSATGMRLHPSCNPSLPSPRSSNTHRAGNGSNSNTTFGPQCPIFWPIENSDACGWRKRAP